MSKFAVCLEFTLSFEGGYVDDPRDPGGCTNRGITLATLRHWRNDLRVSCDDVRALTDAEAAQVYLARYWAPVWGDELAPGVDLSVFDWGVNAGPARVLRELQQITGARADGVMGPRTLGAVRAHKPGDLIVQLRDARQRFYERLAGWPVFGRGWSRRNDACFERSIELASGKLPVELPTLRRMARGPAVKTLQRRLNEVSVPALDVDGIFGECTERAVRTFQETKGHEVTGVVGPETWEALDA